jgi:transcriptional regulator with XRE-family HTH domain
LGIRDKIVELRRSGKSYSEIAHVLGVSVSFVHAVLRVRGLSSSSFRRISDEDLRRAVEMYRAGVSMSEIARMLGVSVAAISGYLRALGIRNRVKSRCPEISREELAKLYLLKGDSEIARIYGTTPSCIYSLRRRYKLLATSPETLLNNIERIIDKECFARFIVRKDWVYVLAALAEKGYKTASLSTYANNSYICKKYSHIIPREEMRGYIVYRQGCEKTVAEHIASIIARHIKQQVDKQIPKTQIIAAVMDLMYYSQFPEEDRGLIRDLIIDMLHEPTAVDAG